MDKISSPALPPFTGVTLMGMGLWMLLFQWRNPIGNGKIILIRIMQNTSEAGSCFTTRVLIGIFISIRDEALNHINRAYFH
ncbi:hypothetical protein [uncultured Porphyromonas sp.]|jgi:hypothetical protein|uniref:hypothetical protein n=1 Tax=uncultured Porphyromonas sp. TaxID=159274 RepID=UPI002637905A|nr:hypothetical protein [uncultured Porphyromonas sp.]